MDFLYGSVYPLLVLIVIGGTVVTLGLEGLWSGLIMLINVVAAGLVATGYFQPLAQYLHSLYPYAGFFWDVFALLALFLVMIFLLRTITDWLSPRKVLFPKLVDQIGGGLMGVITGWVLVGFFSFAILISPVEPKPLMGSMGPYGESYVLPGNPAQQWLLLTTYQSWGAMAPLTHNAQPFQNLGRDNMLQYYAERRELYASEKSIEAGVTGLIQ